jgi:hypothetical protein
MNLKKDFFKLSSRQMLVAQIGAFCPFQRCIVMSFCYHAFIQSSTNELIAGCLENLPDKGLGA